MADFLLDDKAKFPKFPSVRMILTNIALKYYYWLSHQIFVFMDCEKLYIAEMQYFQF